MKWVSKGITVIFSVCLSLMSYDKLILITLNQFHQGAKFEIP